MALQSSVGRGRRAMDVTGMSVEVNGCAWMSLGCRRKSMDFHGCRWKSMDVNGCRQDVGGCEWMTEEVNGCA